LRQRLGVAQARASGRRKEALLTIPSPIGDGVTNQAAVGVGRASPHDSALVLLNVTPEGLIWTSGLGFEVTYHARYSLGAARGEGTIAVKPRLGVQSEGDGPQDIGLAAIVGPD